MGVGQCFVMALKSLSTSKMRAFLTMLGIIIGVAAVIVIMSLGNGMTVYINDMFAELGTTTITVNLRGRGSTRVVTADDLYEFYDENKEVFSYMSPTVNVSATVKTAVDSESYTPSMTGIGEEYFEARKIELAQGRNFGYIDEQQNSKVCIVGAYYDYLYNGMILNNYIKINGDKYTVIGVLEETDDETDEDGGDNVVYIPYSTASRVINRSATVSTFIFLAKTEEDIDNCMTLIKNRLYETYQSENSYSVTNLSTIVDMATDMINIMVSVLSGIAAISLVVGGIGIMNIMLVSVTERTREIGIRKALGAKGKHIRVQFVIEAGTTSALGGIVGIITGILLSGAASTLLPDFEAIPTTFAVMLSFGISVFIGVLFGYLPANKAAKLNPIEALRHD